LSHAGVLPIVREFVSYAARSASSTCESNSLNVAPLTELAVVARAREAGRRDAARPARSAWSVPRQLAARFDGEDAGGAVADSFFVISGSGRRWS
jgi:hypothetical protein